MVLCPPDSWSNWNLEILVFEERGKPEYPEKRREPTIKSVERSASLIIQPVLVKFRDSLHSTKP